MPGDVITLRATCCNARSFPRTGHAIDRIARARERALGKWLGRLLERSADGLLALIVPGGVDRARVATARIAIARRDKRDRTTDDEDRARGDGDSLRANRGILRECVEHVVDRRPPLRRIALEAAHDDAPDPCG